METYTIICLYVFWIYYLTHVMSSYLYFAFNVIHQMPPVIHPLDLIVVLVIIGILVSFLCLISPNLLLGLVAYNAFEAYIRQYLPAMQLV